MSDSSFQSISESGENGENSKISINSSSAENPKDIVENRNAEESSSDSEELFWLYRDDQQVESLEHLLQCEISEQEIDDDEMSVDRAIELGLVEKKPNDDNKEAVDVNENSGTLRFNQLLRRLHLHPADVEQTGTRPFLSQIVRAPYFHLRKWARVKDVIVPSGPQATFSGSVFNMLNSIVGAGILSLPITMSWAGVVLMGLLMPFLGIVMFFTCKMMLDAGETVNAVSYEFLVKSAIGKRGGLLVNSLILIGNFFTLTAYLVLVGDFGVVIYRSIFNKDASRAYIVIGISFFTCFFLSLLSNLNSLRFTSVVAVVSMFFFAGVMCYLVIDAPSSTLPAVTYATTDGLFRAIPVALFAYSCQTSLFPIVVEMRAKDRLRARSMVATSFTMAGVLYMVVAVCGYVLFGDAIDANVLNNLTAAERGPVFPVMLAFLFIIVTSYPLVAFTARLAATNLFFRDHSLNTERGWFIASWLYILALALSLSGVELGFVLSLTGSIASASLTMTLPGLSYFLVMPARGSRWFKDWRKLLAALIFACGLAISIAGLIQTFYSLAPVDDTSVTTTLNLTTTLNSTQLTTSNLLTTTLTTLTTQPTTQTTTTTTTILPTSTSMFQQTTTLINTQS